jgi:hypothetical protein
MKLNTQTFAVLGLILAFCTGCTNVTSTIVKRTTDGSIVINSGKDVTIGYLSYTTNGLVISNYSSSVNVQTIQAQSARESALAEGVAKGITEAAIKGAKPTP